ncbi:hypothetical protein ACLOJK_037519 [Asimina triloba]
MLPPLGCLPSLSNLHIRNMEQLKQIGREFSGTAGGFRSLKDLHLQFMPNLEEWQENEVGAFPCLERIELTNCLQLRQISCSNPFPNLTYLSVQCPRLISLPQLTSLKQLFLRDLDNLEEWCVAGEAHFPLLQQLSINKCPKMRGWPNIFPVLTQLAVSDCQGFNQQLPQLPSLSSLSVSNIPILTLMPQGTLQALSQLKDLKIWYCDELVTLQDEDLPSSLATIHFIGCPNLESLPRRQHALTSLHTLQIVDCPHLTSLPEEGLPSSLQALEIRGCPRLEERCMEDTGEDWPKISHVSHIRIGWTRERVYHFF